MGGSDPHHLCDSVDQADFFRPRAPCCPAALARFDCATALRGTVKLSLLDGDGDPEVGNDRRTRDRIRPVQALTTARTGPAWGGFVQSKLNVTVPRLCVACQAYLLVSRRMKVFGASPAMMRPASLRVPSSYRPQGTGRGAGPRLIDAINPVSQPPSAVSVVSSQRPASTCFKKPRTLPGWGCP